jgi:hypothetical protein
MKNKKGENMKNRTLKLVKGDIIYKNKYPLVRVKKIEQDINKFAYMIFTITLQMNMLLLQSLIILSL